MESLGKLLFKLTGGKLDAVDDTSVFIILAVSFIGFILAMIFGAVAFGTNFCTMGGVSDWINMDDKNRLRAWFLAIGVAILGTQLLAISGALDLTKTMYYRPPRLRLAAHIAGGFMFGVGMTMAGGCGQRILVRLGGGNLKSLVVVLVMGVTALLTNGGILTYLYTPEQGEVAAKGFAKLDIVFGKEGGIANSGMHTIMAGLLGSKSSALWQKILTGVFGLGFVAYAFISKEFLKSFKDILAGATIGIFVVLGWYVTGKLGQNPEAFAMGGTPPMVESFSFVAPTGRTIQYLTTFTGDKIRFAVTIVLGMVFGAFLFAIITRRFHIETFTTKSDMSNHLIGAVLMGVGGVLALGCTIGQGVTGLSTLALGPLFSLIFIILGSVFTLKMQYHLLEEKGFMWALKTTLSEAIPGKKG